MHEWEGEKRKGLEEEEEEEETLDRVAIYRQIIDILKPGETVLKVNAFLI